MSKAKYSTEESESLVSRQQGEVMLKLYREGVVVEAISRSFGVSLEVVRELVSGSKEVTRDFLTMLTEKSRRFRCSKTGRLLLSPVMAGDGYIYEEAFIKDWLRTTKVSPVTSEPIEGDYPLTPIPSLKKEVKQFCLSTLADLEICLSKKLDRENTLKYAAEFLSVLDPLSNAEAFLRVIACFDRSQLLVFLSDLTEFQPNRYDFLKRLLTILEAKIDFRIASYEVVRFMLSFHDKENEFDSLLEQVFKLFRYELPSSDLFNLCLEASKHCNSNQLGIVREKISTLKLDIDEHVRLAELDLRSAELLVREKNDANARNIIRSLKTDSRLRGRLIEFYDNVNWTKDKRLFLVKCVEDNLKALSNEGASNLMVETMKIMLQLTRLIEDSRDRDNRSYSEQLAEVKHETQDRLFAELNLHDDKLKQLEMSVLCLLDHKDAAAERKLMKQEDSNINEEIYDTIYSIQPGGRILYATSLITGANAALNMTSMVIKQHMSFTCLPQGGLFFAGGADYQGDTWVVDIKDKNREVQMAKMNSPRYLSGLVYYCGNVYSMGGVNATGAACTLCEVFSFSTKQWKALPPMNTAVYHVYPVTLESTNCIYVVSGGTNIIQEYNIRENCWKTMVSRTSAQIYGCLSFKKKGDSSRLFFIMNSVLFSFNPKEDKITQIRGVANITTNAGGYCYFNKGAFYWANINAYPTKQEIGEIA